jgi:hypothetical protein
VDLIKAETLEFQAVQTSIATVMATIQDRLDQKVDGMEVTADTTQARMEILLIQFVQTTTTTALADPTASQHPAPTPTVTQVAQTLSQRLRHQPARVLPVKATIHRTVKRKSRSATTIIHFN